MHLYRDERFREKVMLANVWLLFIESGIRSQISFECGACGE